MGKRKTLEGTVISDRMDKAITVAVTRRQQHHLYKKLVIQRKKYTAHDENNEAKNGDRVKIIEARPYSKRKRFKLLAVTRRADVF